MKYKELTKEQARIICKKHKTNCNECPLKRERTDKQGKKHILFCYYILINIVEEIQDVAEEEIKDIDKLLEELKENK